MATWRYIAYSASLIALSTFGAGYFIGLFNPYVTQEFGISNGVLSLIYSISTLAAIVPMFLVGRLIDTVNLRTYTATLLVCFAGASLLIAYSPHLLVFAMGLFFVRLIGDWLFTHSALTTSARHFGRDRARLSGLAAIGKAVGPALFPAATIFVVSQYDWRFAWYVIAAFFVLVVLPAAMALIPREIGDAKGNGRKIIRNSVRNDLGALDRRILPFLPNILIMSAIMAGVLFHQSVWAQSRGGTPEWLSFGLLFFAMAQAVAMLSAGAMAEKLPIRFLIAGHALPVAAGFLVMTLFNAPWTIIFYLACMGAAVGFWLTLIPLLLTSIYGAASLGTTRSMFQSVNLLCTAFSTTALGVWLDSGRGMEPLFLGGIIYILGTSILVVCAKAEEPVPARSATHKQ